MGRRIRRNHKVYDGRYNAGLRGPMPMIRLEGIFLKEHGYNIGDPIDVDVSKDAIIIKKPQPEGSPENQSQA